jgi:hypothetical protein
VLVVLVVLVVPLVLIVSVVLLVLVGTGALDTLWSICRSDIASSAVSFLNLVDSGGCLTGDGTGECVLSAETGVEPLGEFNTSAFGLVTGGSDCDLGVTNAIAFFAFCQPLPSDLVLPFSEGDTSNPVPE